MRNYQHIESANFQTITGYCQEAYDRNLFIGIIGNSGWGKSLTYSKFAENKEGSVFIDEITASMDPVIFFNHIIKGFFHKEYHSKKMYHTILEASNMVNKLKSKSLFIIDEAGNFKIQMHKYIREFRDRTKNNSGLIISGPMSFFEDLERYQLNNKHGIREMMTRINYWVKLEEPTEEEMASICSANSIYDDKAIIEILADCNDFRTLRNNIFQYWRTEDVKKIESLSA